MPTLKIMQILLVLFCMRYGRKKCTWAYLIEIGTHFSMRFNVVACAASRIFVHEDIYDEFLVKCKEIALVRQIGDPIEAVTTQGPQVNS